MNPLVSIIIPTYNRAHLIRETLKSIMSQTYQNWECIIVDDGSSDNTDKLARQFIINDKRFKYFIRPSSQPKGAPTCRNIGFEKSLGDYIQYLDSDDLIAPEKIQVQVETIKMCIPNTLACCRWGFFSSDPEVEFDEKYLPYLDEVYTPFNFLETLGDANTYIPPHCYLVPRGLIKESGGWLEDLQNNQDGEFFVRVLLRSSGVRFINSTKVYYRKFTGDNVSAYSNKEKVSSVVRSWQLIEHELFSQYGKRNFKYVAASKNRLFQNILWENPDLVYDQSNFFYNQLKKRQLEKKYKPFLRLKKEIKKGVLKLIIFIKNPFF